jgi:hypothetical protein
MLNSINAQKDRGVYLVTTQFGKIVLGLMRSIAGRVLAVSNCNTWWQTAGTMTVVVNYCPEHQRESVTFIIHRDQRLCLGRTGPTPDGRAYHSGEITSIEPIDGALIVNNSIVLPQSHPLHDLTDAALRTRAS